MDIFWGGLSCLVGGSEILLVAPALLHLINFGAQEVIGSGHLPKSEGEVI